MRKRKTTPVGKLEQKCERTWQKAVISRDKKCRLCGGTKDLHAHHIVFRSQSLNTKFDMDNGAALCRRCHDYSHLTPANTISTAYRLVGERGYCALIERSRETVYSAGSAWFELQLDALKGAMERNPVEQGNNANCDARLPRRRETAPRPD